MRTKLITLFLLFTSCSREDVQTATSIVEQDYSKGIDHIAWDDIFVQDYDDYYVYFYSTTCGHCASIKNEMINFYYSTTYQIYFLDCTNGAEYGPIKNIEGVSSLDNFYIFGTPFLAELKNHAIYKYYCGVSEIRSFIYKNVYKLID